MPWIVLLLMAVALYFIKRNQSANEPATNTAKAGGDTRGLNRNPSQINYSKHARCRMGCRHIDESEVKQILSDGKINYTKSDLKGDECHKKYAVEGMSHDNQKLRIIFAPCQTEVTVVTVIDIGKEWDCNCD